MNSKAQSSLEFLFVVIVVLTLVVVIFSTIPRDTSEIVALGIAKNKVDDFVLKSNYLGHYTLDSNSNKTDLNIFVCFDSSYNKGMFQDCNNSIVTAVENASNFKNIYIYELCKS